jgi:hypothetical protein
VVLDAAGFFSDDIEEMLNAIKCPNFADKSRFVEPPCKVGDTVYKLTRNKVKKCEVVFIGISADEKCSYFNFVENYRDGTFYKSHSMVFDVIGETVFLTREEAEAALAERRNE